MNERNHESRVPETMAGASASTSTAVVTKAEVVDAVTALMNKLLTAAMPLVSHLGGKAMPDVNQLMTQATPAVSQLVDRAMPDVNHLPEDTLAVNTAIGVASRFVDRAIPVVSWLGETVLPAVTRLVEAAQPVVNDPRDKVIPAVNGLTSQSGEDVNKPVDEAAPVVNIAASSTLDVSASPTTADLAVAASLVGHDSIDRVFAMADGDLFHRSAW
jgi:hypothetical protein